MAGKLSKKNLQTHTVSVVFQPETEGGFTVLVPALPGCITYGRNLTEAGRMAREAIELYLEALLEDGEQIPSSLTSYLGSVEIKVPALHA